MRMCMRCVDMYVYMFMCCVCIHLRMGGNTHIFRYSHLQIKSSHKHTSQIDYLSDYLISLSLSLSPSLTLSLSLTHTYAHNHNSQSLIRNQVICFLSKI